MRHLGGGLLLALALLAPAGAAARHETVGGFDPWSDQRRALIKTICQDGRSARSRWCGCLTDASERRWPAWRDFLDHLDDDGPMYDPADVQWCWRLLPRATE
jgi:hypothetical protein